MAQLRIERVAVLPATLSASTMYIVRSADASLTEIVMTGTDAQEVRHVINKADIQALIAQAVGNLQNIVVVQDIAARDALNPTQTTMALVLDATADVTVATGSAMYVFDAAQSQWFKVAEYESLDLTLTWDAIQGKPNSSVAAIDAAVAASHTHGNKAVLDQIGEANGQLTYNGQPVGNFISVADW